MFVIVGGNGMGRVGCGAAGQQVKSRFMGAGMARDGTSRAFLIWAGIGNIKQRELQFWAYSPLADLSPQLAATQPRAPQLGEAGHSIRSTTRPCHKINAWMIDRVKELDPAMRVINVKDWAPLRRPEDLARLEDGFWKLKSRVSRRS